MPTFMTQFSYTEDAVKDLSSNPDRLPARASR